MKIAITYRIEESQEVDRQIRRLKRDYPGIKLHKSTHYPPFIHAYMTIRNGEKKMEAIKGTKKRLKLSTPLEIRKPLSRIANMLLNKEIDPKIANAITYVCNVALGTIKEAKGIEDTTRLQEETGMKSNRQFTIQQLLRAAEITGDSERREQYLDTADNLIRKELPPEAISAAKTAGILTEG